VSASQESELEPTGPPVRILIADDHAPTREEIGRALEADPRFGVCAEAGDAAGAVDAALRERPDICLLDVRMPGSGLAAAWEIGSRLPATKAVMLTVSEEDHDLFVALSAGVAGYLLKSIDRRRLPHALWDIQQGTFTMPRQLMGRVVERFRGSAAPRRSLALNHFGARLTSREWQVLDLLARGLSTRDVAAKLCITPIGVRVHTNAIVKKLGVRDREAALEVFRRERAGA
jgi:two-component system NarL family response regulator